MEDSVEAEISKVLRAAAQMGLVLAERRRQQLWAAEQRSVQAARSMQAAVDQQRRIAEPVYRRAMDQSFWDVATVQDAAFVYGLARRFEEVDPVAQAAATACQDQAARRWKVDLSQTAGTVASKDVSPQDLAAVAPVVHGEDVGELSTLLDQAVPAESATVRAGQDRGRPAQPTTTSGTGPEAIDVAGARQWLDRHYPGIKPGGVRASREQLDKYAAHLQAALAAEGYDLDNPPRLNPLTHLKDSWAAARAGAWQDLADLQGARVQDIDKRVDSRIHRAVLASKEAEQAGEYPEPVAWGWNVLTKGSEAAVGAGSIEVSLVGEAPRPGTYLPAMRQAARQEAAEAGMDVETYLDHLQPRQRRGLLFVQDNGFYEDGLAHARAYRIAYARESARQRPQWSTREQAAVQAQAQGDSIAEGLVAGAAGAVVAKEAASVAWDSQEARDAWAKGLLEQGFPADAVRAARTADQVLTEPVGSITPAPGGIAEQNHPAAHFAEAAMRAELGSSQRLGA